jgi:hypothetical protein
MDWLMEIWMTIMVILVKMGKLRLDVGESTG